MVLLLLGQGVLFLMQRHSDALTIDARHAREQAAATPSADVTKLTQQVNNQIAILKKTLGTGRPVRTPAVTILNAMPKGVAITKLSFESTGIVRIEGVADTRSTFLQLQDVMKTLTVLKNATTTSTASKREQLPFIYTAKLATP
jgi:Tfp pilus assembly protein PilN